MLLRVSIDSKTIQNKRLFQDLNFSIEQNEKIAIIGRNGVGKTTLFRMLTGQDTDYQGTIEFKKGTRIVNTDQEQKSITGESALEYALRNLPEYEELKKIIDDLPQTMGEDLKKIELYTNSLERFTNLGYYTVSDELVMSLLDYQLSEQQIYGPFARLSGGQKRFIDLARIELSNAQITLIDEPTNHMDNVAKTAFINWFKSAKNTVITITHDRDVLHAVTKIIEIKDGKALIYKGNYDDYLKQNATGTTTQMHDYEISKRTLENLKKQIQAVRAKKASTNKTPNPFIPLEKRLMKEKETLESQLERPSFWIDKDSLSSLRKTAVENYDKYKAKNIKISRTKENEGKRELIFVDQLQLGYTNTPLFNPITFRLHHGDKIQLVGRNGAGKTTLIKAITETSQGKRPTTWQAGSIFCDNKLRLSIYEQELDIRSLNFTLFNAIQWIYDQVAQSIDAQQTLRIMSDYLFDPLNDAQILVKDLSGGQKARLQIIRMLANNPNLLILDEPTNHLDLPSIEELESALATYHGGILYVSHDTYFSRKLGGEIIHILTTS